MSSAPIAARFLCAAAAVALWVLSITGSAWAQPVIDPQSTLGPFVLQAELMPPGPTDVDDDTLLIGADEGIYVFERDPVTDGWAQVAVLTPSDAATGFGRSFRVDGDTAIVGAEGAVYFFTRAPVWREIVKIAAPDGNPNFGRSVDISGEQAIAGAINSPSSGGYQPLAYIFRRMGDTWTEVAQLEGILDGFGLHVAISGNTALVQDARGPDATKFSYIFDRDTSAEDQWTLVRRIGGSSFSGNADLSGDTAVIGSGELGGPGRLQVFERNLGGPNAWGESASFSGVPPEFAARISGDYIVGNSSLPMFPGVSILARNQGCKPPSLFELPRCGGGQNAWGMVSLLGPAVQAPPGPGGRPISSASVSVSGDSVSVSWVWRDSEQQPPNNAVQVLVSDVDGDGIRDARDPCPRDPFNNTGGGCQRASGAYSLLNDFITLGDVTTDTRDSEFVVTATFTNTSETPLRNPFFEVTDLSGDNVLINADGGNGGVGATLSPDVGDGVLSPGEPVTATFRIQLASSDPFTFFVNVRGTPEPQTP